jgi:hypothetical protein
MNRRGFFGLLAGSAVAAAVPELWVPSKKIFLPPVGGWTVTSSDLLISLDDFMRKYIKPAMRQLADSMEDDIHQWTVMEIHRMQISNHTRPLEINSLYRRSA